LINWEGKDFTTITPKDESST